MLKNARGFTIVELLIVIVVIGILAAITVVSFNGVQARAHNVARYHELKAWEKHFTLYRSTFGTYPSMPDGGYCLGTGFPAGYNSEPRCRDYTQGSATVSYTESASVPLMTELKKIGTLPGGPRKPITFTVGPYVNYTTSGTNIILRTIMSGASNDTCPSGTQLDWSDAANNYSICYIRLESI